MVQWPLHYAEDAWDEDVNKSSRGCNLWFKSVFEMLNYVILITYIAFIVAT